MSNIIDERVVSMQFDNQQFEKNVSTSMSTLDKLHRKLNSTGMAKGLDDVASAAKRCDFSPMSKGIETVQLKFSALYATANHYFNKLLATVDNFATKFIKSLTIDPVKTGLKEYETQIGAIQTILANTKSKGSTLEDVNRALDELNRYADLTIYNFTEMTRNIGTFTAAGVALEPAVAAIKGIANLAAVSGSTPQQAATAMYQLSQALAAGRVNLMDWNSVVNADMGGEVFQNALKRTATVMGTDVDAIIAKYGSFRESLSRGEWLTTEVLTKTLEQFTMAAEEGTDAWYEYMYALMQEGYTEQQAREILDMANTATDAATKVKTLTQLMDVLQEAAQSGWAQTWEYIIGNFDEAKELWTGLSDLFTGIINKRAERRNNILLGGEDGALFANAGLMSNWDKMILKITEAGISLEDFEQAVIDIGTSNGRPIEKIIEDWGGLENAIRNNKIPLKDVGEALDMLSSSCADLSLITGELKKGMSGDDVAQMQQALVDLGYELDKFGVDGIFGSETQAALEAFQAAEGLEVTGILDPATIDRLLQTTTVIGDLRKECETFFGELDKLGGRELLIEAFGNIGTVFGNIFEGIQNVWQAIFPPKSVEEKSTALYRFIEIFHGFTEMLANNSEVIVQISNIFAGLFSILGLVKSIITGGLGLAFRGLMVILSNLDLNLLDILSTIGEVIAGFNEWIFNNEFIASGLELISSGIVAGAIAIRDWISAFLKIPLVSNVISSLGDFFGGAFERIGSFIDRFKEWLGIANGSDSIKLNWGYIWQDFKDNVLGFFANFDYGSIFDNFKTAFDGLKDKISGYFEDFDIKESLINVYENIKDGFFTIIDNVRTWLDTVGIGWLSTGFEILAGILVGGGMLIAKGVTAIYEGIVGFFNLPQVSKVLSGIKGFFTNAIGGVKEFFGGFGERVGGFIDRFKEMKSLGDIDWSLIFTDFKENIIGFFTDFDYSTIFPAISGFFTDLKTKISSFFTTNFPELTGVFSGIQSFFGSFGERISGFVERFKEKLSTGDLDWGEVLTDFKENIIGFFTDFDYTDLLTGVKTFFTNIKTKITDFITNFDIKETFNIVVEKIKEFFSNIFGPIDEWLDKLGIGKKFDKLTEKFSKFFESFKKWLPWIIGIAGALLAAKKIKDIVTSVVEILHPISSAVEAFKGLTEDVGKSMKMKALGDMVKSLAMSIVMIAGAILVLSFVDKKDLFRAAGVVAGIGIFIAGLMVLSKFVMGNEKQMAAFGGMMLSISGSILLMGYAIKMLGGLDKSVLDQGMETLTKFLLGIVGLMAATKLLGNDIQGFGKMMFKLASALLILAVVIRILGGMDPDTLDQGMKAVAGFMGMVALMMLATKLLSKDKTLGNAKYTNTFMQFGKMMIALSASLLLMAAAVKILGSMDKKTLIQGGLAITAFLGMMVGMMAATKLLAKDMPSFAGMIAALGVSLLLLTASVAILGNMDTGTLIKGGIAVAAILAMFAGMMAATKLIGQNGKDAGKVGLMMLAFSGAMIIMAGAIKILSTIDHDDLAVATAVIAAVGLIFAKMTEATKYIKGKTMGTVIAMIGAVAVLATALYVLAGLDTGKLLGATAALSIVMGAFSVMLFALKTITGKNSVLSLKTVGMLAVMTGIVAALGGIVYLLANNIEDPDGALKSAIALSAIILALSGACALLSVASKFAPKTKSGIIALGAIMGLVTIFSAIGIAALPTIGKQLSSFMEELEPFVTGVKGMDSSFLTALKTLAEAMLMLSGASFIFAIGDIFGGSSRGFDSFKEFIKEAVPIIKDIAIEVSKADVVIDTEKVNAIVNAVKGLAEAASKVPSSKGFIAGGKGFLALGFSLPFLSEFTEFVKTAVPVVKQAAIDLSGSDVNVNTKYLTAVVDAIVSLAEAANTVPGVNITAGLGKFKGITGLVGSTTFTNLKGFATFIKRSTAALVEFMESLSETDDNGKKIMKFDWREIKLVNTVCNAINSLANAANSVPETSITSFLGLGGAKKFGGFGVYFSTKKYTDLKGFATFIKEATSALVTFMESLSKTDENGKKVMKFGWQELRFITPVCNAINSLANAASSVPESTIANIGGGLGKGSFKKFGGFIGNVHADYFKGADLEAFANFIGSATSAVVTFMESLSETDAESGKKIMKFDNKELKFLTPVCEAISSLAVAAQSVPESTIATLSGGAGKGNIFGKYRDFGIGGGGGGVSASFAKGPDLEGFANFIGTATLAVVTFMEALSENEVDSDGNLTGKKIPKFTNGELDFLIPVCDAIKVLAEAANLIEPDIIATLGGGGGGGKGGLGGPFGKFALFGGGGGIDGKFSMTSNIGAFAGFITESLNALAAFTEGLVVNNNGKKALKFTKPQLQIVTQMCEALKAIGGAMEFVPKQLSGTFGFGGGKGGWGLGTGKAGAFGGGGSFSVTPMLDEYTGWITDTLTALSEFTATLMKDDGTITLSQEAAERVVTLCTALGAIGGAMEHVPSKTDFDINWEAFGGGGSLSGLAGIFHMTGNASGSIIPMIDEFGDWIEDALTAMGKFAITMDDVELSEENLTAITAVTTAVDTLAQAAQKAPTYTKYEGVFGQEWIKYTDLNSLTTWIGSVMPLMSGIAAGKLTDADGKTVAFSWDDASTENIGKLKSIAEAVVVLAEAAGLAPTKTEWEALGGLFSSEEYADPTGTVNWFEKVYKLINGEDGLLADLKKNPLDESAMLQLNSLATVALGISKVIWNLAQSLNTGTVDTTNFGIAVDSLRAFYDKLVGEISSEENGMDLELINKAVTNVSALANALIAIQNHSVWLSEGNKFNTEAINTSIDQLVTAIDGFATKMSGITDPTTAIAQLNSVSSAVAGLSTLEFTGSSAFKTALEDLANTGIDNFIDKFETADEDVKTAANGLVDKAASAIETKSNYDDMKDAGKYLGEGLVEGIEAKEDDVYNAAYALGQKAVQGEKDGQKSESPSKLTIQAGHWFGEGLVIGINEMGKSVYNAGYNAADSAKTGLSNAIANVRDLIDSDMDTQPTIRPVLDMSDVKAGLGSIDGMLSNRPSIGVMANVGTISSMMNNRQNGANDDVISAIADLGSRLGRTSGDTYNINGITYDDGSNVSSAVQTLIRAARVERRR